MKRTRQEHTYRQGRLARSARRGCIGLLLSVVSCGAPQGATGVTGEWVKGKALTVRVNIISQQADQPSLDLRNDTGKDLSILPLRVIAWYEKSGKQEKPEQPGQLYLAAGQTLTGLTLNLSPPVGDRLQKIQIFHGLEGGKEQEVFTITRPSN